MSVKIRLARHGRRKAPYYRLVVADSRYPRDGRFIEILGFYQPLNKKEAEQEAAKRALLQMGVLKDLPDEDAPDDAD